MELSRTIETETGEMIVKRVSVPLGLEELMEGLAKEVILKKPKDIYIFAADYFSRLLQLRDSGLYRGKVRSAKLAVKRPFKSTVIGQNILPNSDSNGSEKFKGRKTPHPRKPLTNSKETTEERRAMIQNHLRKKQDTGIQKDQAVSQPPREQTNKRSRLPTRSLSLSKGSAEKNPVETTSGNSHKSADQRSTNKISARSRSTSMSSSSGSKDSRGNKKMRSIREKDSITCSTENLNKSEKTKSPSGNVEINESDESISVTQDKNGHYEVFYRPMPLPVDDSVVEEQSTNVDKKSNSTGSQYEKADAMVKSITTIQALWRGRQERKLFRKRLDKNRDSNENITEMKERSSTDELLEIPIKSGNLSKAQEEEPSTEKCPPSSENITSLNKNYDGQENNQKAEESSEEIKKNNENPNIAASRSSVTLDHNSDNQKDNGSGEKSSSSHQDINEVNLSLSESKPVENPLKSTDNFVAQQIHNQNHSSPQDIDSQSSQKHSASHFKSLQGEQSSRDNSEDTTRNGTKNSQTDNIDKDEYDVKNDIEETLDKHGAKISEKIFEEVVDTPQSLENADDNINDLHSKKERIDQTVPPTARPRRSLSQKIISEIGTTNNVNVEEKKNNIQYHRSQTIEMSSEITQVLDSTDENDSSDRETLHDVNSLAFHEENSASPEFSLSSNRSNEEKNQISSSNNEISNIVLSERNKKDGDVEIDQENSMKTESSNNKTNDVEYEEVNKTDNEMKNEANSDTTSGENNVKLLKYEQNMMHNDENIEAPLIKMKSNEEENSQIEETGSNTLNVGEITSTEEKEYLQENKENDNEVLKEHDHTNSTKSSDDSEVRNELESTEKPISVNKEHEELGTENNIGEKVENRSIIGVTIKEGTNEDTNNTVEETKRDLTSKNRGPAGVDNVYYDTQKQVISEVPPKEGIESSLVNNDGKSYSDNINLKKGSKEIQKIELSTKKEISDNEVDHSDPNESNNITEKTNKEDLQHNEINKIIQDENSLDDKKGKNITEDDEEVKKEKVFDPSETNKEDIVDNDQNSDNIDEYKEKLHSGDDEFGNIDTNKSQSDCRHENLPLTGLIDTEERMKKELEELKSGDTVEKTVLDNINENGMNNKISEENFQENKGNPPEKNNENDFSNIENKVTKHNSICGNENMNDTIENGSTEKIVEDKTNSIKTENDSKESVISNEVNQKEVKNIVDSETKNELEKDITKGNGNNERFSNNSTSKVLKMNENEYALKIQTTWRGFQARKHLKKLMNERLQSSEKDTVLKQNLSVDSIKDENENLPNTKNKNIQDIGEKVRIQETQVKDEDEEKSIGIKNLEVSLLQNGIKFTNDEIEAVRKIQKAFRKSKKTQHEDEKSSGNNMKISSSDDERKPEVESEMMKKNYNALGNSPNSKENSYSADEIRAVIKLQSMFRKYRQKLEESTRKTHQNKDVDRGTDNGSYSRTNSPTEDEDLLSKKPESFTAHEIDAATKIQSTFRRMRKKRMNPKVQDLDLDSDMGREYLREILKIQSAWRAYRVKKNIRDVERKITTMETISGTPSKKSIHLTDEEILKAVTKIQAGLRGYLTRRHYNNVREKNEAMDKIKEESSSDYSRMSSTSSNDEKLLEILKQVDGACVPDTIPDIASTESSVKSDDNCNDKKGSLSGENLQEDIKRDSHSIPQMNTMEEGVRHEENNQTLVKKEEKVAQDVIHDDGENKTPGNIPESIYEISPNTTYCKDEDGDKKMSSKFPNPNPTENQEDNSEHSSSNSLRGKLKKSKAIDNLAELAEKLDNGQDRNKENEKTISKSNSDPGMSTNADGEKIASFEIPGEFEMDGEEKDTSAKRGHSADNDSLKERTMDIQYTKTTKNNKDSSVDSVIQSNSAKESSEKISSTSNRPTLTDFMIKTLEIGAENTSSVTSEQENRISVPVKSRYESATKIQSVFRGYRARKYVESLKASSNSTKVIKETKRTEDKISSQELEDVTNNGDKDAKKNSHIPLAHTQDIAVGPNGNVYAGGTQETAPGVEILTTEACHAADVGQASGDVESDAQPSKEDAKTQDGLSSKSEFESEREMESTKRNNSTLRNKNMEVEAATKIQAGFRGYKVRKQLKMRDSPSEQSTKKTVRRKSSSCLTENQAKKQKENIDLQEKSAVKIQAGIRGFLVRKKVKRPQKSQE